VILINMAQELEAIKRTTTKATTMLSSFIKEHTLPEEFTDTAEQYYLPLADSIVEQFKQAKMPFFVGINGCQGSGKSTLTDFLGEYIKEKHQLNVVVMSLDDFYFSSKKRQQLAQDIHPLLATRGVPGTHDIEQLAQVLSQLKAGQSDFSIPKFNKATDDPFPKSQWPVLLTPADIVIVEGWCWGVMPQTAEQLIKPINELEQQQDGHAIWRSYVNQQLERFYQPLYAQMDFWLALQAPSFDCVFQWRLEQEQKLLARNTQLKHSKIMTPPEVLNFTQYFQRLSVQGCNTISHTADTTFYLDYNRSIVKTSIQDIA